LLATLTYTTENAAKERYLQALNASGSPTALPQATPQAGTAGILDQHYYFVNGCVSAPVDCGNATPTTWGEYYEELRRLYDEAAQSAGGTAPPFDEWATEHIHFISANTANVGAGNIAEALPSNSANADIHMIGTSAGGASIVTYLSRAMRGEVPLDRRIRSAIIVDSPLGFQPTFTADDVGTAIQQGAMKADVAMGVGEWAKAAGITLLTVDTDNDIVGHDPVPETLDDPLPVYPEQSDTPPLPVYLTCTALPCQAINLVELFILGSTWHVYTGSHMAEGAKDFIGEHWR
jgi:hypothetical protein